MSTDGCYDYCNCQVCAPKHAAMRESTRLLAMTFHQRKAERIAKRIAGVRRCMAP